MLAANVERRHELSQRSRPATSLVYEKHTQPCDENNYVPKPRNASPYPASQVGCGLARRPFPGGLAAHRSGPAGKCSRRKTGKSRGNSRSNHSCCWKTTSVSCPCGNPGSIGYLEPAPAAAGAGPRLVGVMVLIRPAASKVSSSMQTERRKGFPFESSLV